MDRMKEYIAAGVTNLTNRRMVDDLRKRAQVGIIFLLLIALSVYVSYDFSDRHPELLKTFIFPLLAVGTFRGIHLVFFSGLQNRYPWRNSIVFALSILTTAAVWGIAFKDILMLEGEYRTQILMTMVSAGICSGGVVAYIPNMVVSLGYNYLIMWPVSFYMYFYSTMQVAGLLFFLYSWYMTIIVINGNREYWTAIRNEELLLQQSEELERLSRVDVLTGLYNRRYFEELFEIEWRNAVRRKEPISILICDLDNFKQINDKYGHLTGDQVLKITGNNLQAIFRRLTDIICRIGGEEFVILLPIDSDGAKALAEQMCRLQAETAISHQGNEIDSTISIGLSSVVPDHSMNKEVLIANADKALYQAKNRGKNRVCIV